MFRTLLATAALLALTPTLGASPPDVPKELRAEPGQNLRVVAKGEKISVGKNFTDEMAFFEELKSKDGERRFMFQATRPGIYVVAFATADEIDSIVLCTITVGPKQPDPPPPGPSPPPDAQPSAELVQKVRDAYLKDKGTPKDAVQLAALYREAAKLAIKRKGDGYEVPSTKELLRRVRESSTGLIGDEVLVGVRVLLASELSAQLGMTSETELTEGQRKFASDTFVKLAVCLEVIAK